MDIVIPMDKMSAVEKLRAIETIWNDLQHAPDNVPSPAWHEDVLRAREARVREGKSHYTEWSDAKDWIRDQICADRNRVRHNRLRDSQSGVCPPPHSK